MSDVTTGQTTPPWSQGVPSSYSTGADADSVIEAPTFPAPINQAALENFRTEYFYDSEANATEFSSLNPTQDVMLDSNSQVQAQPSALGVNTPFGLHTSPTFYLSQMRCA